MHISLTILLSNSSILHWTSTSTRVVQLQKYSYQSVSFKLDYQDKTEQIYQYTPVLDIPLNLIVTINLPYGSSPQNIKIICHPVCGYFLFPDLRFRINSPAYMNLNRYIKLVSGIIGFQGNMRKSQVTVYFCNINTTVFLVISKIYKSA